MAPTVFRWRHLANFVTLTHDYTNTFVDDLLRLSQIKQELVIPNLEFNFL